MARTYRSRLSHDDQGRRVYGLGGRYNRPDVNSIPLAVLSANASEIDEGETVTFDDSGSVDSGSLRQPDTYTYDFGDGSAVHEGRNPSHEFTNPGTFTVTLSVTDRTGVTSTDSLEIVVNPV